ncbi:AT hook containing transcription factor 1 homolog [Colletes latitarsis]|uniref:AT hook containing transcription factor 1 homolog n=1 Tax=Colletes latitarsis TaxID=2605962 RepID=UPI004035E6C5
MKELEEVNCEVRSILDIQHSVLSCLNNAEGDDGGLSNNSQVYNGFDNPCGGFLNDATYAWLSYGCHILVLNTKTGESTSSWTFRGKITCVCQFPTQCGELPLLLVGLDNKATRIKDSVGLLCIFDCSTSRVLRAIRMPAGIEQVCIVSGGAEWEEFNDQRPDNILMQMDGIACVVLRNLNHLMIDLQRSAWEVPDLSLIMDETSPAEIEYLTSKDSFNRHQSNKSKHMACNLLNQRIEKHIGFNREEFESIAFLDEKLTNTIVSSTKIGCLISGCLGRVIIWQNNGSVGWISLPVDETMIVTHLALLEPTDDPRPFYYLWVVFQDDLYKVPPLLRMYALLFERKYCDRGTNLYFNLEAEPSLKFEFELDTNDRVVSLSTIERGANPDQTESEFKRGEDSLLLVSTTNRALLFDLNQWYKEQMPQTIGECKNPNSILASYNTKLRPSNVASNEIICCTYIPRTLQEFPNNSLSSLEELFYPNSLSLEWIELSLTKLTFWLCRGVQAELLREMALAGPFVLTQPSKMFHKCLSIGLVPFNTDVSFTSDHNVQRDMLLSLCLEQRWATFLIRCAKEWSDGSAAYMYPSFLKWGIQRASSIKMIADNLCIPLFDQSGNNIGESDVKTLRFCYQQLECLSNVVAKLPFETSNLINQRRVLKRVSMYFQVLLWFYDVGLLPEFQDLEEGPLPLSLALKIPYPYEKLFSLYKEKRESINNDRQNGENEVLFIDELITRECPVLTLQWEREASDTSTNGYYPPPSLQSLLRSYLTDCDQTESNEIQCKHQITIYLLMDLAMLLQGSYPGVDQLIKYPSSFKMSPSLIKLTQAFWLLDHDDYHGFLDMMTGPLICDSDVKDWHHKLILRTLVRNGQHKLALMYLRVRKPPLSSIQDQSTLIDLSVEHGLVQSAFHRRPQSHYAQLLMCFFQACKTYDKLGDILHLALSSAEEEMFIKFLEESKSENIRLLYYLQRCRYMEANSGNSIGRYNAVALANVHADMLNAYNATLPDVVKRFNINMDKTNLDTGLEPRYPRPMTYNRSSQCTSIYETVIKKARETFLKVEKSVIPFITAPCTTLKLDDNYVNINCVMSPKVIQTNRKRTLDDMQYEESSEIRTPDKIKRRKLLDDGEAAINMAFSTPLVKRKVSSNRNTPIETPHSILKIRQLIRSSTSSTISPVQGEIIDSSNSNGERKINRQIRFNISQSKKNNSYSEVNSEDNSTATPNIIKGSNETFFGPTVSEESLMESPVLTDSSYTCINIHNARPRPSLRRTSLQASTESLQDSSVKCSKTRSSRNYRLIDSPSVLENCNTPIYSSPILSPHSSFEIISSARKSNKSPKLYADNCLNSSNTVINSPSLRRTSLQTSTESLQDSSVKCSKTRIDSPSVFENCNTSIYSSPILSPHSSFEIISSARKSNKSPKLYADYNCLNSSNTVINNPRCEKSRNNVEEPMNIDDNENNTELESYVGRSTSPIIPKSNYVQFTSNEQRSNDKLMEDVQSKYNNGDVLKNRILETENEQTKDINCSNDSEENVDNEKEFKSFSSTLQNNSGLSKNRERRSWLLYDESQKEPSKDIHEHAHLKNTEQFDITDDESSNSGDEVTLGFDETDNKFKRKSRTSSAHVENMYNVPNITDDESDFSEDINEPKRKCIVYPDIEESVYKESKSLTKEKENVESYKTKKESINLDNNNSSIRDEVNESIHDSSVHISYKDTVSTSNLDGESSSINKSVMPRMTRSRRASSITKETSSPFKVAAKSMPRRASSLVKEVLTASIATEDEDSKRTDSFELENSSSISSPRKARGRRASSVSKDVVLKKTETEDEEAKIPVRRSTRRAASVQKELPEPTKPLTKISRTLSSSSLVIERKGAKDQIETKSSRKKNSTTRERKLSSTSSKSAKESKTNEEEMEEVSVVKLTRRRSSSVPKEMEEKGRGRRSSSILKETIPENYELSLESTKEKHLAIPAVNSPAANTRSRRSSIQSIPEELEEILSVPSNERISTTDNRKQATQSTRQRRASSVGLLRTETQKRTRATRSKGVLKEVIPEEEVVEVENEANAKVSNVKKVSARRKRTLSERIIEEISEDTQKTRSRKPNAKQDVSDQFSFSQPEETDDAPLDQKAIGEVPNYVFSPPHTRSKNVTSDHRK